MLERNIFADDVKKILLNFIIVEEYSDDKPFPGFLILGYGNERPLHAVISYDLEFEMIYVITLYEPSIGLWEKDFTKRRKRL